MWISISLFLLLVVHMGRRERERENKIKFNPSTVLLPSLSSPFLSFVLFCQTRFLFFAYSFSVTRRHFRQKCSNPSVITFSSGSPPHCNRSRIFLNYYTIYLSLSLSPVAGFGTSRYPYCDTAI